ncbi:MAG: hypothetical protein HY769_06920 [Candidatus Stahlbacteria bacterium]|nr:hypothetical protein [Candidatus Stahlbacteria bacterium]
MRNWIIGVFSFVAGVAFGYQNYHGVSFSSNGLDGWVCCLNQPYPPVIHTTDGWQSWSSQTRGPQYKTYDIFFLNDTLGWTAGDLNEVRRTTDGGNTWTLQTIGTGKCFPRIYFIDERHGWAAGGDGMLGITTNGGTNWQDKYLPISHTDCYGVFFIDSLNGWLVSRAAPDTGVVIDTSCIFRTASGGNYWTPQYKSPQTYDFLDVRFVDLNSGWVCGGYRADEKAIIFYSTNGGAIWNLQSLPDDAYYLRSLDFVQGRVGFAVGKYGTILHTTDGTNWELQESGVTVTLFDVDFIDSLRGVSYY